MSMTYLDSQGFYNVSYSKTPEIQNKICLRHILIASVLQCVLLQDIIYQHILISDTKGTHIDFRHQKVHILT